MATRRAFLQVSAAGLAAAQAINAQERPSATERIRFALIGAGSRGFMDAGYAVNSPGTELAAVCDVYDGKLTRAREVFGNSIFTTRDYHEVLARKDIDAVILSIPDHLHAQVAIDALRAGKHVYLEKPMVHKIQEGHEVIDAWKSAGKVVQVGSQYTTSVIYRKVAQLIREGAIGQLNQVEGWFDRNTAVQYFIPPDASPATIDWDRFLGPAPKRPFEPERLFRWRNYSDYSTFVAGDLFIHLISALHAATGATGPTRIYASGGNRYWKDLGEAADVLFALLDYPETTQHPAFNLVMRVNLKSGLHRNEQFLRFVGSGGTIKAGSTYVSLNYAELRRGPERAAIGYDTLESFPKAMQQASRKEFLEKNPEPPVVPETMRSEPDEIFLPPAGHEHPYYAEQMHMTGFFDSIRRGKPVAHDPISGLRAAGPAQLCNTSYVEQRICRWDPASMREV